MVDRLDRRGFRRVCQEKTREGLIETLKITLQEAIEFNKEDDLIAAGQVYMEEKIAI